MSTTYEDEATAQQVADGLLADAEDVERYLRGERAPLTIDQLRLAEPWLFDPMPRTSWQSREREMCERAAVIALIRRNPTIRMEELS
jgi:hypothetical protein